MKAPISLLILCVILYFFTVNAQNTNKIEGLFNTYIKSAPTQLKVFFLDGDFDNSLYNNPEKAKEYALEILIISKNANYKVGIAIGHNLLGM